MNITINGDCYAPTQPSSKTQGWVGLNKKKATLSSCLLTVDTGYDIQIEIHSKEKGSLRGKEWIFKGGAASRIQLFKFGNRV